MPDLVFDMVKKSYSDKIVIREFNAHIEDGEFVVILGPSGCGKSTLLRMIAGLTSISGGNFLIDGEVANDWDVRKRKIAFVFQSYALYPHMTVRENISFPLIMERFKWWQHLPVLGFVSRKVALKNKSIISKVNDIANELGLNNFLNYKPSELSGEQRQRVALARSLVRDPDFYLLDEPLSNLDAKLRVQMRSVIVDLFKSVKKTFIYVTHDQVEAMTMATKVIVLNNGVVQQIGSPEEVYLQPNNIFVAKFIGSPSMNLIRAKVKSNMLFLSDSSPWMSNRNFNGRKSIIIGIRPERLRLCDSSKFKLSATIKQIENLGSESILGCSLVEERGESSLVDQNLFFVRVPGVFHKPSGSRVFLDFEDEDSIYFDSTSGINISR